MAESSRYLSTFMNHLAQNKMGHTFARLVTRSLDRKVFKSRPKDKTARPSYDSRKIPESKRKNSDESQSDKISQNFKVKEGSLGYSIKIRDNPSKLQQKQINFSLRLNVMSPRKNFSRENSRSQSREKGFPRFNTLVKKRQIGLTEQLQRRKEMLKINRIDIILSTLTRNPNVSNLRIYKQTLKKFYANRFVREKITTFFDYQYIQDYDSQMGYLQSLLDFKLEEIYYLCFLVLDQNGDGLLCSNDLFVMSTASSQDNPLINKDIFKIFEYVTYYRNMKPSVPIMDLPSDEESFKTENTNLHRYRFLESKKEKEREKSRKLIHESQKMGGKAKSILLMQPNTTKHGKKYGLTRKTHKHLFSVRNDEEDGQTAIKQLRKRFAQTPLESQSKLVFKVNFNTFKTIFMNTIPETYYDLLYVIGGIKLPEKKYLPFNFDLQDLNIKDIVQVLVDKNEFFNQKVVEMKNTYRKNRIQRLLTQSESLKSLYC